MTEKRDVGGSASWMTLRDWFAGQALVGRVSKSPIYPETDAATCYRIADAMVKEREKGKCCG